MQGEREALLPCPFCGCEAEQPSEKERHHNDGWWDICCSNCSVKIEGNWSQEAAIAEWNKRAPSVAGGWRPIETLVPVEGMEMLVLNDRGTFVATWDDSWMLHSPVEEHPNLGDGWFMVSDGKELDRPLRGNVPTHWQPLPAPPGSDDEFVVVPREPTEAMISAAVAVHAPGLSEGNSGRGHMAGLPGISSIYAQEALEWAESYKAALAASSAMEGGR